MYFVYIVASQRNGTLYIGMTDDLVRRVWQHRQGLVPGFTKKYGCKHLVWFDSTDDVVSAIRREKQMKAWKRRWKLELIESGNPNWEDLYEKIAPIGTIAVKSKRTDSRDLSQ